MYEFGVSEIEARYTRQKEKNLKRYWPRIFKN